MGTEIITKCLKGIEIDLIDIQLNHVFNVYFYPELLKSLTINVNLTAGAVLTMTIYYSVYGTWIPVPDVIYTSDTIISYADGTTPCFTCDSIRFAFIPDVSTEGNVKIYIVYQ